MKKSWFWTALVGGLIAITTATLLLTSDAGARASDSAVREISLSAHMFAFDPSQITVSQGDRVRVTLTSTDVTHGFYLDSYGARTVAHPGQSAHVEFVADRAGTFRFRCAQTCGAMHPFMIGKLTVLPAVHGNPGPFAASAVLTLLVALAAVAWNFRSNPAGDPT